VPFLTDLKKVILYFFIQFFWKNIFRFSYFIIKIFFKKKSSFKKRDGYFQNHPLK